MSASVTLSPTRNVFVASALFRTSNALLIVAWACSVAWQSFYTNIRVSRYNISLNLCLLTYLFVVLHDTQSWECPCATRWQNLIIGKVDILLYQGSVAVASASQLSISHCNMDTYIKWSLQHQLPLTIVCYGVALIQWSTIWAFKCWHLLIKN